MPAKKKKKGKKSTLCPFLFQLLMIAGALCFPLGPRNAHLKNRPDVHGGCQPQFFLMRTLILCVFPRSRSPSPPPEWPTHQPANYQGRFPAPAHCWPLCGLAAQLQAREQSQAAPGCRSTQPGLTWLRWHLMREVQGIYAMGKSDIVFWALALWKLTFFFVVSTVSSVKKRIKGLCYFRILFLFLPAKLEM